MVLVTSGLSGAQTPADHQASSASRVSRRFSRWWLCLPSWASPTAAPYSKPPCRQTSATQHGRPHNGNHQHDLRSFSEVSGLCGAHRLAGAVWHAVLVPLFPVVLQRRPDTKPKTQTAVSMLTQDPTEHRAQRITSTATVTATAKRTHGHRAQNMRQRKLSTRQLNHTRAHTNIAMRQPITNVPREALRPVALMHHHRSLLLQAFDLGQIDAEEWHASRRFVLPAVAKRVPSISRAGRGLLSEGSCHHRTGGPSCFEVVDRSANVSTKKGAAQISRDSTG